MKLIKNMRQFLSDFRDNDPEFSEKILDALRDSLSDESIAVLFWKYRNKFLATHYPVMPEAIKKLNNLDGYGFMVPSNWANHCDWISFGEDKDGNDTIMCPSEDPENPHVVYNFYDLWDKVLDYLDFDIDDEIESIMDYWEKEYTNR